MFGALLSEDPEKKAPEKQEVEEALDFLIDKLRGNGQLKQMLDEYLREKIAEEKAKFRR